jgi:SAM-dependent methyltransferase
VACGTGYWTQFIAPHAAHVAIDATPERLDIVQKRISAKNVDFHIADAYALPDQLGRFDAAFAGFSFSHVPRAHIRRFLDNLHGRLDLEPSFYSWTIFTLRLTAALLLNVMMRETPTNRGNSRMEHPIASLRIFHLPTT